MCYAVSTSPDPLGSYYRYEFLRPLFPDYPRPAVWPDGYYVPTSTGDNVIQKHACVVDRTSMLAGQDATEQCFVLDGVNFLNNADLDGKRLPPAGAPNIMMATGGRQLDSIFTDDGVYVWQFQVDWEDPSRTRLAGPEKILVAPYHYLCDGQLTSCVPQPGTDRRLDSQGDKIMARLVYRNLGNREAIVAVHSVAVRQAPSNAMLSPLMNSVPTWRGGSALPSSSTLPSSASSPANPSGAPSSANRVTWRARPRATTSARPTRVAWGSIAPSGCSTLTGSAGW